MAPLLNEPGFNLASNYRLCVSTPEREATGEIPKAQSNYRLSESLNRCVAEGACADDLPMALPGLGQQPLVHALHMIPVPARQHLHHHNQSFP